MIDKFLAIDVETTGFDRSDDVTRNNQIVSIGLVVADNDLSVIDKFYCEIKWNGTSRWNSKAEQCHGLSKDYLEKHGLDEEDAVVQITEFILKYYDIDEPIHFIGHNARSFDIPFFQKLTNKYGISFKVAHRAIDSFGIGYVCLGTEDSDELFGAFYEKRDKHNSLDDALMALGVCRKIRKLFQSKVQS